MTILRILAVLVVVAISRVAVADQMSPDDLAERQLEDATRRAKAGDLGGLDALEALGAARPITRWTDNAWSEAGRVAERRRDYARARRAFEQVIAIGGDDALVARARAALARLATMTAGGTWDAVTAEHLRLATEISAGGDPRAALDELEQLARKNAMYPQLANAWLTIARGWEIEGEGGRALELLRERWTAMLEEPVRAEPAGDGDVAGRSIRIARHRDRERIGLALARLAIRRGELFEAGEVLDRLAAISGSDRAAIGNVRAHLETATQRTWTRRAIWVVLLVIAAIGVALLRRDVGSWRAVVRRLARPPVEVLFLLPVGAVLVVVAQTGNPVVARALLAIVIAGLITAWLSGAALDGHRARRGRVGARRAVLQAMLAIGAVAASAYLAIDRDRLLDLVEETLEHGPSPR